MITNVMCNTLETRWSEKSRKIALCSAGSYGANYSKEPAEKFIGHQISSELLPKAPGTLELLQTLDGEEKEQMHHMDVILISSLTPLLLTTSPTKKNSSYLEMLKILDHKIL